jgi:hypothetical protein
VADDIDLTPTRKLSQTLFGGAQYRIEVGAAIAESDGIVCMVDLVRLLGDPPGKSSVNAELKVLERANLLTRPNIKQDRRIDLVRQDSPWWEMCLGLREATAKKRARRSSAARSA